MPSPMQCEVCSPPSRGMCSPPSRGELPAPVTESSDGPCALPLIMLEGWCSPTLKSPAGRPCSVLELAGFQEAEPVNIFDPYLEDKQWDQETMVLSTIAGQLEDPLICFSNQL